MVLGYLPLKTAAALQRETSCSENRRFASAKLKNNKSATVLCTFRVVQMASTLEREAKTRNPTKNGLKKNRRNGAALPTALPSPGPPPHIFNLISNSILKRPAHGGASRHPPTLRLRENRLRFPPRTPPTLLSLRSNESPPRKARKERYARC